MDLTLTAITAAVVTACFITAGVKDEAPVFPTYDVESQAVVSVYIPKTDETEDISHILSTNGYLSVYSKNKTTDTITNRMDSYGVLLLEKSEQVRYKVNSIQSTVEISVISKHEELYNLLETLNSTVNISATQGKYVFSKIDGYFKHTSNTYPYYVTGWYNKTMVFGSYLNIYTSNLKENVTSTLTSGAYFLGSIPPQTDRLITTAGMGAFAKTVNQTDLNHEAITTAFVITPSNINPYRTTDLHIEELESELVVSVPDARDLKLTDLINTVVNTLENISYFMFSGVEALHTVNSNLENISVVYGQNIQTSEYLAHETSTQVVASVMISRNAEVLLTCDSNYNLTLYIKDLETIEHLNSVTSAGETSVFFISPYDVAEDINSDSELTLYIKDATVDGILNTTESSGQSDMVHGNIKQFSRTEDIHTTLGNVALLMTPGLDDPVGNTVSSTVFVTPIYGDDTEITEAVNTLTTLNVTDLLIDRIVSPSTVHTLNSEFVLTLYIKDTHSTNNLNTLNSSIYTEILNSRAALATNDLIGNFGISLAVKDSTATLLNHTVNTDWLSLIDYEDPREVSHDDTLQTSIEISMFSVGPVEAVHTVTNSLNNIQIRVKDVEESVEETLITSHGIELYVNRSTHNIEQTVTSVNITGIVPSKIAYVENETITDFLISTHYEDNVASSLASSLSSSLGSILLADGLRAQVTETTHTTQTGYGVQLSVERIITSILDNTETTSDTTLYIKDATVDGILNTTESSGQSDMVHGNIKQFSRTEDIHTTLGALSYVRNPGVLPIIQTLDTVNELTQYVKDSLVSAITQELYTTQVVSVHSQHGVAEDLLNTTNTSLGNMQLDVVHPVTITLNKQTGTGGTDSIITVAGFSITPSSVVPPTRTHYNFNGYYTLASGGIQIVNSAGVYVALTDSTFTSDVTLYAQWTAVLYTITWQAYGGATLKTENLVFGATSNAPTGTADTAQYDYEWPKSSTTVSGNETITETRTIKSYTITWYRYGQSGETYAKRETLNYGATSNAPTGTADTDQYDYEWPKSSTTVTGTENITETRTTKSYTVTWYRYGQSGETYAKRETLTYGSTSNAPTGTTDTAQYDYNWPKASTTVVGTENITETRTLLSYTITWYFFSGAVAKQETLTYGSISNAPAGTADDVQWDYSWPKSSTTVVGTENINETRVIKQYTITWKFYSGSNALVETLNYGSTSTAPIGTADTTEWDYSWPKGSTTVVGTETINETRAAKSYTLTFEGNGTTPSPTSKSVTWSGTYGTLATVSKTNWKFLGWYNNFDTHETPTIIAHWPLDGNLNDISGNKLNGSLQGATTNTEGKIGGSYTFANTRIHTVNFNSYLSTNAYTYTAWINRTSSQNEYNMFMGQGLPYFSFRAGGQLFWSNSVDGTQRTCITSETFNNNTWYHFTATYDGTYMKIFVNGVEKASTSQPGTMSPGWLLPFSIGDGINSTWYPFYGKVNDVRIYNEVLSVDEIKEIAQAKIMHYTFDTCGEPTTNISGGIQPTWFAWGTPVVTGSSSYTTLSNGKQAVYMTSVYSASGGVKWRNTNNNNLISVSPSTAYSMSAFIKYTNNNPSANLFYLRQYRAGGSQIQENGWYSSSFRDTLSDGWYYAYRTVTLHAECVNVRLESYEYSTNEIWMYDFQFEQKNNPTPYTPTSREGLIIDSSPYKRHATAGANYPSWTTTQNANGRASYLFSYTNQDFISLPYFKTDTQAITLSAWMRSNDITKSQNIISRNGPFFLRVTSSTLRVAVYTGTWVFANGSTTLSSNVWYHLVLTYDGARVKGYVNGVLDIDVAKTGDMASWAGTIRLGYTTGGEDAPMDGYIDDVRIYATALAQADITLLYNTQTLITSGTTVRTSKDHIVYAHWNPSSISGLLNTVETNGQSDIAHGSILQLSRTEDVHTLLGDMQYENQTVFNITLNPNGGSGGTTTITGSTGIDINPTSITVPSWTNYTFNGYFTATSGGTKYINSDGSYNGLDSNTFVGNATLYAQWTMNNVYFDWNPTPSTIGLTATVWINGESQQTNSLDWYQLRAANATFKISTLGIPNGWQYSSYTTTNLVNVITGGSGGTTEVQGDGNMAQTSARAIAITVTGISYSVSVTQNGGTGSSASVSTYTPKTTTTVITMTRGTYTNFRFWNWTVSGANGQASVTGDTITIPVYTTSVQPYGNLIITANWKPATTTALNETVTALGDAQYDIATPFTVTLDKQSGSGGISSITCVNGFYLDPTSATVPSRNGYTFGGYYTETAGAGTQRIDASGNYIGLTNTTYSSAVTLYAKWTLITYTLTNDRNGGTGGNNSATYNITTSSTIATLFGAVTRTGYTLSNWRWTSSTAGGWVNNTDYATSTNVSGRYATGTLQAQWTANNYTVTFNANGGGTPSPTSKSVTFASTYGTLATVSRTNWVFTGWYTAATGGTLVQSSTTVTITAAQTLYAHWTPTLTSGTNETITTLGDMQTEYTGPTYNITTSSGTGVASMSVNPTTYQQSGSSQNITITRSASTGYTLNAATITRLGDYGGSTPTVSGTTVTIPADSYGNFRVDQTATANSFDITLTANGGTTASNNLISVQYNTSIEAFNTNMLATRTGYTTTGYWTATSGGTQRISASVYVALTSTTYTAATTLYAQWTANNYTVTFNANGGGTPSPTSKQVTYASTYGTLATVTRFGYTLTGWWTASSGGTQITSGTTVSITANQTLYAQWTVNSFVITLNANGGTTASNASIDCTYGTSLEAFTTTMRPTRANYLFRGYYTATSGGTQRISPTAYTALTNTTYGSADTLYAQWDYAPNFPTVRSTNSGALTTAGLTLTVTLPTGHAAGDLLIIGVSLNGSRTMSAPAGWTLLANPTNTTENRHAVWYKTRGASESNPAITWVTTTEIGTWYSIAITTGTWSGTPAIATAYGSSTTPNPPSLAPTWGYAKTLWLALNGWDYNRTSTTVPTNYTLMTYQAGSSTVSAGHRTFQRSVEVATEDPGTITLSASDTWYAHTVAVKPAIAATTSTPTVGTPYCLDDGFGTNTMYIPVTNTDTSTVTVYMNGVSKGTIAGSSSSDIIYASGFNLNYDYNVNTYTVASGKSNSETVNKTGTITICVLL